MKELSLVTGISANCHLFHFCQPRKIGNVDNCLVRFVCNSDIYYIYFLISSNVQVYSVPVIDSFQITVYQPA